MFFQNQGFSMRINKLNAEAQRRKVITFRSLRYCTPALQLKFCSMNSIIFLCLLIVPLNIHAKTEEKKELTLQKFNQCIQYLQNKFVSYSQLAQALSFFRVSQSQWVPISDGMKSKMRELNKRVKEKAARIKPNPLNPFDPKKARELLKNELYTILYESMLLSNYPSEAGIGEILNYLITKQPPSYSLCFFEPVEETTDNQKHGAPDEQLD